MDSIFGAVILDALDLQSIFKTKETAIRYWNTRKSNENKDHLTEQNEIEELAKILHKTDHIHPYEESSQQTKNLYLIRARDVIEAGYRKSNQGLQLDRDKLYKIMKSFQVFEGDEFHECLEKIISTFGTRAERDVPTVEDIKDIIDTQGRVKIISNLFIINSTKLAQAIHSKMKGE